MKKRGQFTVQQVYNEMVKYYEKTGKEMKTVDLLRLIGEETSPETVVRAMRFFMRYLRNNVGSCYGMVEPLRGYDKLSDEERKVFVRGHQKHLSSLPAAKRNDYSLNNVAEVKPNKQDQAVDARFTTGEWFTFNSKGAKK